MTISPNRSAIFHGSDPVAGALRAALSTEPISRNSRDAESSTGRPAALNLEALYPSLFVDAARPARRSWSLRRLVPQH